MTSLNAKVVLVTGGASAIVLATAVAVREADGAAIATDIVEPDQESGLITNDRFATWRNRPV